MVPLHLLHAQLFGILKEFFFSSFVFSQRRDEFHVLAVATQHGNETGSLSPFA